MTKKELINAILSGNSDYILAQAAKLTEGEKAAYAEVSLKLFKAVSRLLAYADKHSKSESQDRVKQWLKTQSKFTGCDYLVDLFTLHCSASVAMVSFCAVENIPRSLFWGILIPHKKREQLIVAAMRQRCDDWKLKYFSTPKLDAYYGLSWENFWEIMSEGASARSMDDRYIEYFIDQFSYISLHAVKEISPELLRYPAFLQDDIWGVFRTNSRALAPRDQFDSDERGLIPRQERWYEAIYKLAHEGKISRSRLLDECLKGLALPLSTVVLANMLKFFEGLAVTNEELVSRSPLLVNIAASSKGKVLNFAMQQLQIMLNNNAVAGSALVEKLPDILDNATLGKVKLAVKLINLLLTKNPNLSTQVIGILFVALENVQGDVAAVLIKTKTELEAKAKKEPSIQAKAGETAFVGEANAVDAGLPLAKSSELMQRVSNLTATDLSRVGIAMTEASGNQCYLSLVEWTVDWLSEQVLPAATELLPVTTLSELSTLLKTMDDGISIFGNERILDGAMRLYNQGAQSNVIALLDKSILKTVDEYIATTVKAYKSVGALKARFESSLAYEQCLFVLAGGVAPALSLPSHASGWLAPQTLIERFNIWQKKGLAIISRDFILALLRLAPDSRTQALKQLIPADDVFTQALSWALGSNDVEFGQGDEKHALLWLAAARARQPYGDITALVGREFADFGPNMPRTASMDWCMSTRVRDFKAGIYDESLLIEFAYESQWQLYDYFSFPATLLYDWQPQLVGDLMASEQELRLAHSYSMANDDGYWVMVVRQLCYYMDVNAKFSLDCIPLLEPLEIAGKRVNETMVVAIILSLMMKRSEFSVKGVSIVRQLVDEERFDETLFAKVLGKLLTSPWEKSNRLVVSLTAIAEVSSLHSLRMVQWLESMFSMLAELPKSAHHLLSLAVVLSERLGYVYQPSSLALLKSFKASGKAATLLKKLIAMQVENRVLHNTLLEQRIVIRLASAERAKQARQ